MHPCGPFFFRSPLQCIPCFLFLCKGTMAKWIRRWKPIWIPCGANFQKVYVEEWEQKVHASEYSDQEPEYHWRDPCPRYHQSHASYDEIESNYGPYLAPMHAETRAGTRSALFISNLTKHARTCDVVLWFQKNVKSEKDLFVDHMSTDLTSGVPPSHVAKDRAESQGWMSLALAM